MLNNSCRYLKSCEGASPYISKAMYIWNLGLGHSLGQVRNPARAIQHEITSAQHNNDRTSPQGGGPPSEFCQLEIKRRGSMDVVATTGGQPWQDMLIAADLPGDAAWPSTPAPQQGHCVELLQAPSCHVQACSPPSAQGMRLAPR